MAYNESAKQATLKYKSKAYKRIPLDVRIEEYEAFKAYCDEHGESVNGLIRKFIKKTIETA